MSTYCKQGSGFPVLDITQLKLDKTDAYLNEIMKTTRPGKHVPPVELIAYPHDSELCPVSMVQYKENKRSIHLVIHKLPHLP